MKLVLLMVVIVAAAILPFHTVVRRAKRMSPDELMKPGAHPELAARLDPLRSEATRLGYEVVWTGSSFPSTYTELHIQRQEGHVLVLQQPSADRARSICNLFQIVGADCTALMTRTQPVLFRVAVGFAQVFPKASLSDLRRHHLSAVELLEAHGLLVKATTADTVIEDHRRVQATSLERLRTLSTRSIYFAHLGYRLGVRRLAGGPLAKQGDLQYRIARAQVQCLPTSDAT